MYPLIRTYALSVLRSPGPWLVALGAAFIAWAGIALDLFGFDGTPSRSLGVAVGTFELAILLLAVQTRLAGITSSDGDGFYSALLHRVSPMALEVGAAAGAGAGATLACLPWLWLVIVVYNLYAHMEPAMLVLTPLGLAAEATVAAAWTGLAFRVAGRVPAIAVPVGAFVLARVALPAPVRALLPSPSPANVGDALSTTFSALLAAFGLALTASSLARTSSEGA